MKIERFEDIVAWQKGKVLVLFLYGVLRSNKDFGFKDQIQRAAVSITNNIAEGYERRSNKELKQFLFIAKGSVSEVRSMLHIGLGLKYFNQVDFDKAHNLALEIARLLSGFIKTL
ncbi:MAG: four helix bundle protein [Candidatus Doudnabacteria bacterium]|nr:four helix bundle protein [Candidatus Doudnabacteria bacterium]